MYDFTMSDHALRDALRGVAFTMSVPFDENAEAIRYDAFERNLQALDSAGARLYVPCGNTGEYYSLSREERVAVVESTVASVDDDSVVLAGAGGSAKNIIDLADAYSDVGADGLMVMHPSHTYIHEDGIKEYYRQIAAATDLDVVLYKRGPELSDGVIAELSTVENIVGVKYAVNDVTRFSQLVDETADDFVLVNGIAERFAVAFAIEGAEGFTTGIGNFVPNASLALQDALVEEDWQRAKRIRNLVRPYENLREETGPNNTLAAANNVPAVKYGMELAGLAGGPVRPPLVDLSTADRERAEKYYRQITDSEFA